MYTYAEQRDMVDQIHIKEGENINIDCPFCGGRKTFGITIKDGKKLWHCFKISCGVRGVQTVGMSSGAIRRRLNGIETNTRKLIDIPSMVSSPSFHPAAMKYLEENNCLHAYNNNLIRIEYAPAEHRVLFYSNDNKGAVGRSIIGDKPKWKQYGNIEGVIKVGSGNTAVVVEDIPSACAVSMFPDCSGCALLGTMLSTLQKVQLSAFDEVILALDKDASRKAIELQSKLEWRVKTRVVFLEEDLKWLTGEQIEKALQ